MKRSTENILYVTPSDYALACQGIKTATTRLGDRSEFWPVGSEISLINNENDDDRLHIRVVYNDQMTLEEVTDCHAQTIGGYDRAAHWEDFAGVYGDVDENTELSLVGFLVL